MLLLNLKFHIREKFGSDPKKEIVDCDKQILN
jgi:hypothetical protein